MKNIDKNNVTKDNINYLQQICSTDFYKNDREFISIIRKLTEQSAKVSNKALSLVSILNEAEKIKFDMMQKEVSLGLKERDKPYGKTLKSSIKNKTLINLQNTKQKLYINNFISMLEKYFKVENTAEKKNLILEAKEYVYFLRENNIEPLHLIITKERSKVWYLLEQDFKNTIKKFDINLFIEKIKLTRLQHQSSINEIREYNRKKSTIEKNFVYNENDDNNIIPDNDSDKLSTNIEPLLIDTKNILESIDLILEDIPSELSSEQIDELKKFMPALSEYYIDQCHAVSGGYSYTPLNKNLAHIQRLIDNESSVLKLLYEIDKLDNSMQHLYLLHWINESLLKEIFNCKNNKCTIGPLSRKYNEVKTKNPYLKIYEAINIRNDIAHNAMIWEPLKLKSAIETYRKYVNLISDEQKINLKSYVIPKMDRVLTIEQKNKKSKEFIINKICDQKILVSYEYIETLDEKLLDKFKSELVKSNWYLDNKTIKKYKGQFKDVAYSVKK